MPDPEIRRDEYRRAGNKSAHRGNGTESPLARFDIIIYRLKEHRSYETERDCKDPHEENEILHLRFHLALIRIKFQHDETDDEPHGDTDPVQRDAHFFAEQRELQQRLRMQNRPS